MTLVVIGASPAVADAAAGLPVDLVHVRMPGASPLRPEAGEGPGARTEFTVDYQHEPAFLAFVDEVLRPLAPAAVVSLTELGLEPAAVAARRLGAAGVPVEVVRATRDKLEMRRVLARKAPHLNPAFAAGDADAGAVARLFVGGGQAVAKPVAGTGSHAVALLRTPADLPEDRRNPATLLERYVEGREFSVEALSSGGRHTVLGIAEKRTTTDGFVEVAHLMPAPSLDAGERLLVVRAVGELLDAVGLRDGPSHTEVKVDGATGRVTVIETHNRPGGDGIPDLVRLTTGVDWWWTALGWAVGEGPPRGRGAPPGAQVTSASGQAVPPCAPDAPVSAPDDTASGQVGAAATVFFTAQPGRVTAVAPPPPALAQGRIAAWDVQVEPGDPVHPLRSSADRLGMATLTADSPAACSAAVCELMALPVVTTQPDDA